MRKNITKSPQSLTMRRLYNTNTKNSQLILLFFIVPVMFSLFSQLLMMIFADVCIACFRSLSAYAAGHVCERDTRRTLPIHEVSMGFNTTYLSFMWIIRTQYISGLHLF